MIDVIIPISNAKTSLNKILLSIVLQDVCDKINVVVIDNCSGVDCDEIINFFSKKINIKLLKMDAKQPLSFVKQYGIDNTDSEFLMFLGDTDFFYDCFSISNLYNAIVRENVDMAFGKTVQQTENHDFIDLFDDYNFIISRIYRRSFFKDKDIKFNSSEYNEDCGFYGQCCLKTSSIFFVDSIVCVSNPNISTDEITFIKTFIENKIWAVKSAHDFCENKADIKEFIYNALQYLYQKYINNLCEIDSDEVLHIIKPLEQLYKDYSC